MDVNVTSEIGRLRGVILHTPGPEVENMTPENAERALYSDILSLNVVQKEYEPMQKLFDIITKTFQVKDLLTETLHDSSVKRIFVDKILRDEEKLFLRSHLLSLPTEELSRQIIEGVHINRDNLTNFLSKERFDLRPLHNFFFTRDASVSVGNSVLACDMANKVRSREAYIMDTIFSSHPELSCNVISPLKKITTNANFEGGDILIARDDLLVIGNGVRTSTKGIDYILDQIAVQKQKSMKIIVQELPDSPESFIHLDMVFTFLDVDSCMVFEPIIMNNNKLHTVSITVDNGKVKNIKYEKSLLSALKDSGIDVKPIICGGNDEWSQEREQWHSGANFFAVAPGKVMGYARNIYTMEELNKNGFEIIKPDDIISGKYNIDELNKCMIALDGSELPRGGGGVRCMTMPVSRDAVM